MEVVPSIPKAFGSIWRRMGQFERLKVSMVKGVKVMIISSQEYHVVSSPCRLVVKSSRCGHEVNLTAIP